MEASWWWKAVSFILLFCSLNLHTTSLVHGCGPGVENAIGITDPPDDIFLSPGSPLNLSCSLFPGQPYDSSSLIFLVGNTRIDEKYIQRVNSSTIFLSYPSELVNDSGHYFCKVHKGNFTKGVCFNAVRVIGDTSVKNFSCTTDLETIECTWLPANGTNYEITHSLEYYDNDYPTRHYNCSVDNPVTSCKWKFTRFATEVYTFDMVTTAGNKPTKQSFTFYKSDMFVPSKPEEVKVVGVTSNSITIEFEINKATTYLIQKVEILYRISHYNQYTKEWIEYSRPYPKIKKPVTEEIKGLPFANTQYDIRVSFRSAKRPKNGIYRWSDYTTPAQTPKTAQARPGQPPKTVSGSFDVVELSERTLKVTIFWQQILKQFENGRNFSYVVTKILENEEKEILPNPSYMKKTYAVFTELNKHSNYTFYISSFNSEGFSNSSSTVVVPKFSDRPPSPRSVKKIAASNDEFLIEWTIANYAEIDNFTVFWCNNKQDRPYICTGFLNWTTVPRESRSYRTTLKEDSIYQFAVASNSKKGSSGMLWAECTQLLNEGGANGIIKTFLPASELNSTSIRVLWKLDCSDNIALISGYRIFYCPIMKVGSEECKGEMKNVTIDNAVEVESATVGNLKPHTTYKFIIIAFSNSSETKPSRPIFQTTSEAAPSGPPENITLLQTTNSSLTLAWEPPKPANGVISKYEFNISGTINTVEQLSCTSCNYTFLGLKSGETYTISVRACTAVDCSPSSSPMSFSTKMGAPEEAQSISVKEDFSLGKLVGIDVSWAKPNEPRGPIHLYDICIFSKESGFLVKKREQKCYNTSVPFIKIVEDICTETTASYHVKVRALNIDENGSLMGKWSSSDERTCKLAKDFGVGAYIILGVVGILSFLVLSIAVGYFINCAWAKYKYMIDVEPKLPRSMMTNDSKNDTNIQLSTHSWTSDIPIENVGYKPDQELLLSSKENIPAINQVDDADETNGQQERESSGCGSGHVSVTSSINGGEAISSDSGTEADQMASSPEDYSSTSSRMCQTRQNYTPTSQSSDGFPKALPEVPKSLTNGVTYSNNNGAPKVPPKSGGYVSHPPHWNVGSNSSTAQQTLIPAPTPSHDQLPNSDDTLCLLGRKVPTENLESSSPSD